MFSIKLKCVYQNASLLMGMELNVELQCADELHSSLHLAYIYTTLHVMTYTVFRVTLSSTGRVLASQPTMT